MPKVSRETASQSVTLEGHQIHTEDLEGGYSVCFETHTADADVADWFRGLPDDRCQVPRWGYVLAWDAVSRETLGMSCLLCFDWDRS